MDTIAEIISRNDTSIEEAIIRAGYKPCSSCQTPDPERDPFGMDCTCEKTSGGKLMTRIVDRILWRDSRRRTGRIYKSGWGMIDILRHWDERHTRKEAAALVRSI